MLSKRAGVSFLLVGLVTLTTSVPSATAATFTVTNTNDAGPGTYKNC